MAARKNPSKGSKPDKIMRDAISLELSAEVKVSDPNGGNKKVKLRRARLVAIALVNKGIKGDVAAIREINERMDGKVTQVIGGTGAGGAIPIDIKNLTTAQIEALMERIVDDLTAKGILGPGAPRRSKK